MDIKRELERLKLELIMTKPFFGNVLYSLEFREDRGMGMPIKAEGTHMKYSPNDIDSKKLSVAKLRYLVFHETYHILLLHQYRLENRNRKVWNIVCDMVIEYRLYSILEKEFGRLNPPPHYDPGLGLYLNKFMVFDEGRFRRESEEGIYNKLNRNYEQNDGRILYIDEVFSINLDKSELEKIDESAPGPSKAEAEIQRIRIESIISESVTKDRLAGNSSAEGMRILGMVEGKPIEWRNIIRRQLQMRLSEETSFSHPDSRFHWNDMIIPDFEPRENFLELLVVLDLSSSIGREEVNEMLFQIKNLSDQFELRGRVLGFSTDIVLDEPLDIREIARNIGQFSFGGTDWNCVLDYIREKKIKYSLAITITDGKFHSRPVDMVDHIWIITAGNKMGYRVTSRVIEL